MKNAPGGILLEFDDFPPSPEVLARLILRAGELSAGRVLIHAGRQFCWGFDDALRDCAAYPEEVFQGIMSLGEKRGICFLPVITPSDIDTFISAHASTSKAFREGNTSVLLKLLQRIVEGLVEDLLSVFRDAEFVIFLSDSGKSRTGHLILDHPEVLSEAGDAADIVLKYVERGDLLQFIPGSAESEETLVPVFPGGDEFSLPAPPGWLGLLDESYESVTESFLSIYKKTDNVLKELWSGLRSAWEGRGYSVEDESAEVHLLYELLGRLDTAAEPLFSRDWFISRRKKWIRGFTRAFMYQQVEDDRFGNDLSILLSLLESGQKQGQDLQKVFSARGEE